MVDLNSNLALCTEYQMIMIDGHIAQRAGQLYSSFITENIVMENKTMVCGFH